MAALPAEASHFRDRDALNPYVADRFANLVELERFDDRCNELHAMTSSAAPTAARRKAPLVPAWKSSIRSAA
jgi:hypothetical protein